MARYTYDKALNQAKLNITSVRKIGEFTPPGTCNLCHTANTAKETYDIWYYWTSPSMISPSQERMLQVNICSKDCITLWLFRNDWA